MIYMEFVISTFWYIDVNNTITSLTKIPADCLYF